jgi:hypothetical protein
LKSFLWASTTAGEFETIVLKPLTAAAKSWLAGGLLGEAEDL